ncbi:MAG: superoxide dismutase [Woeseiaceae bacterium]|nr:superoxide dismutase [Woeseiaceae bacterium]
MAIELPDLPYEKNALAPHVSPDTMALHYGKHHKGYVKKLNKAIADSDYEDQSLETIITRAHDQGDTGVYNNAAQTWNHTFLWHSMSPDGGGKPTGQLAEAIDDAFGDLDGFRKQFKKAATGQFGSGWAWLVENDGKLDIVATGNADTPVTGAARPLLTLDVWEHAYYLDYQNRRGDYVDAFLKELINWEFAAANLSAERAAA